jgi:hypothetical protein
MSQQQPLEKTSLKLLEKIEQKAPHFNGRINIMGEGGSGGVGGVGGIGGVGAGSVGSGGVVGTEAGAGAERKTVEAYECPLTGLWEENLLSKVFFCAKNVQIIQNGIRYGVYHLSNGRYIIDEQDVTNLHIIMRSIFLEYASNRCQNITDQVEALNKLVLDYCVPTIYDEVVSYMKYKNDVSTLPVPPSRPAFVSGKGDKVLEMSDRWFNPPKQMKFTPESALPNMGAH